MVEYNELDVLYPTDTTEFNNIYGYYVNSGLNYNFGLTSTMGELETRRAASEDKESLQGLMKESGMASELEQGLESHPRISTGLPGGISNRYAETPAIGQGMTKTPSKRGRRRLQLKL